MTITIERVMFGLVIITTILAAIVTVHHLFLKKMQCYDSWLFPVFLAMFLQMYENVRH